MTLDLELLHFPDSWYGSYYELAMELGPTGNDAHLEVALKALWRAPGLTGPWSSRGSFSELPDAVVGADLEHILYGVATVGAHQPIGVVMHVVREPQGSDWVDICFPTGMLNHLYALEYPLYSHPNSWRSEIDAFLVKIAASVFASCPFRLALIGEEVSGIALAATLEPADCASHLVLLPATALSERFSGVQQKRIAPGLVALGLRGDKL